MRIENKDMKKRILRRERFTIILTLLLSLGIVYSTTAIWTAQAAGTISGRVFQDFNSNGLYDTSGGTAAAPTAIDKGIDGVQVRAFDPAGVNVTPGGVATVTANGTFSFVTTATATNYRLEFTNIPAGFTPSAHSTDSVNGGLTTNSGSTVQFVTDGATTNVNLALNRPKDFCQDNPLVCATTYSIGDADDNAIFTIPYTAGSTRTTGGTPVDDFVAANPTRVNLATTDQVGTTYGMAYSPTRQTIYAAAFMKKHAKFGPGGTGAIYQINRQTTAVSEYVNLNTLFGLTTAGLNPHNILDYNTDNGNVTWNAVGKVAFGGMAMSDDETKIYAMNLANRTLYEIPLNAAPTTANIRTAVFPTNDTRVCPNAADVRPFAVTYYENQLYLGAICSGDTSNSVADLKAFIYRLNPATLTFGATPTLVFQTALNYPRLETDPGIAAAWREWTTNFTSLTTGLFIYPQPWLTDIDFDNGNLILSLRDRNGDQTGFNSASNPGSPLSLSKGITAGDILRACGSISGGWTLESNGRCGGIGGAPQNTNEGPGGGEYYYQDNYHPNGNPHDEVADGGVLQLPGYNNMIATIFDPTYVPNDNIYDSGGFRWFVNSTGAQNRGYLAYQQGAFGKANGIGGNLPALCDLAPIEIGNRVWNDTNGNGVQDPGEAGIPNVNLALYKNNAPVKYIRYRDEFDNISYNGSTGAVDWSSTPWVESGDDNNISAGDVQVLTLNTPSGNILYIRNGVKGLSRPVNLAGTTSPTLIFNYFRANQGLTVQYSTNNGTNYTTAQTIATATDTTAQTASVSIPNNATNIRIRATATGTGNAVFIDNFQITANAATITDSNGEYYFSSASGLNAANSIYLADILPNMADYEIRLDTAANYTTGGALNNLLPTTRYQTAQNGFVTGSDSDAGLVTNPAGSPTTGTFAVIPFSTGNSGDNNHNLDAGFATAATYSLGNRVWYDTNNDGMINVGEVGISGVLVSLLNSAGTTVLQTVSTDANGYYRFDGLAANSYKVRVNGSNFSGTALGGYQNTTRDPTVNLDSTSIAGQNGEDGINPTGAAKDVLTTGILSSTITLGANQPTNEADVSAAGQGSADAAANMTVDFGFYKLCVSGTVWRDVNNNALLGSGETGIGSVRVQIYNSLNAEILVGADGILGTSDDGTNGMLTNSSGNYNFCGLAPGQYRIVVTPNGGTSSTDIASTANPDNNVDNDDNGFPNNTGVTAFNNKIISGLVTLTPGVIAGKTNNTVTNSNGTTADPTVDFGFYFAPTAVSIAKLEAFTDGNGVRIEWATGGESKNLGFNVYRESNGRRELINPTLIAGSAIKSTATLQVTGGNYGWTDNGFYSVNPTYWLEDIDLDGTKTLHGPITPSFKISVNNVAPNARLLTELSNPARIPNEKVLIGTNSAEVERAEGNVQRQQAIAAQKGVKISINHDGWYRVTAEQLQNSGFDINSNRNNWQLFANAEEVPIQIDSNGSIDFFGRGIDTISSGTQVYYLVGGNEIGRRIGSLKGAAPGTEPTVSSFPVTIERKDRIYYISSILNGEAKNWFGDAIFKNAPTEQILNVQKLSQNGQVRLSLKLQGLTNEAHLVNLRFNNFALGTIDYNGVSNQTFEFDLPLSAVIEGENKLYLQSAGAGNDISLIDTIRLSYEQKFIASDDNLRFMIPAGQTVLVKGFSTPKIRFYNVKNGTVADIIEADAAELNGSFAFAFLPETSDREILALKGNVSEAPAAVEWNNPSNLSNRFNSADFVIITPELFRTQAERLANIRQSQGLRTRVVLVDDIFDEFNFGSSSPEAIKDFLQTTQENWRNKPRYAVLFGNMSYDLRNYSNQENHSLMPSKLIDTSYMETMSDTWLADFNGDNIEDIGLGRLPANTAAEAEFMVNKLVRYDAQQPRVERKAVLISDRGFESYNNILQTQFPGDVQISRIDRTTMTDGEMNQAIITQANESPSVLIYNGHGGVTVWAGLNVFLAPSALTLTNEKLSFVVMLSCLNGYADNGSFNSMAASFFKAENGGAYAAWASSGETTPDVQLQMAQPAAASLFSSQNNLRIGDILRNAKQSTQSTDVRSTWWLVGDPTVFVK